MARCRIRTGRSGAAVERGGHMSESGPRDLGPDEVPETTDEVRKYVPETGLASTDRGTLGTASEGQDEDGSEPEPSEGTAADEGPNVSEE